MSKPEIVLGLLWIGVTAYALLGGADFGAGFWDLVAGDTGRGASQRALIERVIGPVWEANHVWLIFALVVLWTGFPTAFAAITSTLFIPLTATAIGVILRGSAFAFRKAIPEIELKRVFGATFAASSVITPFFLGAVAGGVASGRVSAGNARGDALTSWLNPTSVLGGTLAVVSCAYLAAVYLCRDAERAGDVALTEGFRTRALVMGGVVAVIAAAGIAVLRTDAPRLFDGLTGRGLPLVVASAVGGVASAGLLWTRRFALARVAAAAAITAVIWGWAAGQYPFLLQESVTIEEAAAADATLDALIGTLIVGGVLLAPALGLLFLMAQRDAGEARAPQPLDR